MISYLKLIHNGILKKVALYDGMDPDELSTLLSTVFKTESKMVGIMGENELVFPLSLVCKSPEVIPNSVCTILTVSSSKSPGHHQENGTNDNSSQQVGNSLCNYFRYSCHIVRGRTIKQFRARIFGLAEIHSGYTFDGTTDGIHKAGKDIDLCLYFESRENLNRFQSEVIELISRSAGFKRPLIEEDASVHLHEVILQNEEVKKVTFPETAMPVRVFKYHYQHDFSNNDPDNSADCDGYSDMASLQSTFGEYVNIADPEIHNESLLSEKYRVVRGL